MTKPREEWHHLALSFPFFFLFVLAPWWRFFPAAFSSCMLLGAFVLVTGTCALSESRHLFTAAIVISGISSSALSPPRYPTAMGGGFLLQLLYRPRRLFLHYDPRLRLARHADYDGQDLRRRLCLPAHRLRVDLRLCVGRRLLTPHSFAASPDMLMKKYITDAGAALFQFHDPYHGRLWRHRPSLDLPPRCTLAALLRRPSGTPISPCSWRGWSGCNRPRPAFIVPQRVTGCNQGASFSLVRIRGRHSPNLRYSPRCPNHPAPSFPVAHPILSPKNWWRCFLQDRL